MRNFYIDGIASGDYNIHASGEATYNAAERDVQTFSIPGRNGDLIIDNGRYKNIEVKYPCVVSKQFLQNAANIRKWLGAESWKYRKITDDYDTDHFRLGRFRGQVEFEPMYATKAAAQMSITFDCKPQRFLAATDYFQAIGFAVAFQNPTGFPALPIFGIRIAAGTADLSIGADTFHFDSNLNGIVYLDYETQNLYKADAKVYELGYLTTTGGDPIDRVEISRDDADKLIDFINGQISGKTMKHLHRDTGAQTSYICGKASTSTYSGTEFMRVTRSDSNTRYYLATPDKKLIVIGESTSAAVESYLLNLYSNPVEYENGNYAISGKTFTPIEGDTAIVASEGGAISAIYMNARWWEL